MSSLEDRLRANTPDIPESDTLTVIKANTIKLTVGELRGQLKNNTDPRAIAALKGVKEFPDQATIAMEREDLLAIIDGKEISIETVTDENGNSVFTKKIVETNVAPTFFEESDEDA
jgi:hypothetical protein